MLPRCLQTRALQHTTHRSRLRPAEKSLESGVLQASSSFGSTVDTEPCEKGKVAGSERVREEPLMGMCWTREMTRTQHPRRSRLCSSTTRAGSPENLLQQRCVGTAAVAVARWREVLERTRA